MIGLDKVHTTGGRSGIWRLAIPAVFCLFATVVFPTITSALAVSGLADAPVYLVNAETGRYLDGDRDGAVRQSLIPNEDDQWQLTEVRSGVYTLRNVQKKRLLDADGRHRDYDVNLSHHHEADTEWELFVQPDGSYSLVNVQFGRWLEGLGADAHYNARTADNNSGRSTQWHIAVASSTPADLGEAVVLLANGGTGRFLSADANGEAVQVSVPTAADQWLLNQDADGSFTIRNIATDRLLHVDNGDVVVGGEGRAESEWRLTVTNQGTYKIQSVAASGYLDGDYENKDYDVDLTTEPDEADGQWNVLIVDADYGCQQSAPTIDRFLTCLDATDTFVHLEALQAIADMHGGIRASGTPGYDASVDYVAGLMQEAGLSVERQSFEFTLYNEISSSISFNGVAVETQTMAYSPSGVITGGTIVPVDLDLGLDNASTSGCESEDFNGLDFSGDSDIALIQRGACAFSTKALNADAAGAEAVLIFNQGNTPDRVDIIGGTLGEGVLGVLTAPTLDISYGDGEALAAAASGTVNVAAETEAITNTTENVIADLAGVNTDNVVMAGAHLDSVQAGPGIQDNGSGSAALLSIALELAGNSDYTPQNSLRFAWWGAEESGLIGSFEYFTNANFGISEEDAAKISGYLNFDMIASPNFLYGIYDADETTFEAQVPVPEGSEAIEDLFEAYFSLKDIPYEDTMFSGRSDYQAFILSDIPSSGLFTGAEGIKTAEQASIWGGSEGEQFDQCYHLACDTIDNVSFEAFETNLDAVAYALINLAATTEAVNGVVGIALDGPTPDTISIDGPRGTFDVEGGGGAADLHVHHDHDEETE